MFEPARHIPLRSEPWDETVAGTAIRDIVDDALRHFDRQRFWPSHPREDGVGDGSTFLYFGATGVIWALDHLRREGAVEFDRSFTDVLPHLSASNRAEYAKSPYPHHASLLMGDVGVLLLSVRLAPDAAVADELFRRINVNLGLPVLELMWGMPGTMLACVFMHEMTGEPHWRDLYVLQAEQLLAELEETDNGPLWTQTLYGRRARYLGPVHGFAGNMLALLRGWAWLSPAQCRLVADAVPRALAANARRSEMGVNWPAVAARETRPCLVQHCHGAPGIVTTFAGGPFRTPELDALLLEGGELTWHAGPLAKGSNLCHGTGGNGYAFLKLYKHTGDSLWLERARAFAMTAIRQCEETRRALGRGRFSLWTGDLGLAVFLWDCIRGQGGFPTADVF